MTPRPDPTDEPDPRVQFHMKIPLGSERWTNGRIDYTAHPERLGLSEIDLSHSSVLDIATNDGYWAFWAEQRGADDVLAIDVDSFRDDDWDHAGPGRWRDFRVGQDFSDQWADATARFLALHSLLGSEVRHREMDIYALDPAIHGVFDLTFMYGLLGHLRHPLLGLERACGVTSGALIIETHALRSIGSAPVCAFYEDDVFRDPTYWTGPTEACVVVWLRSLGLNEIWTSRPLDDEPEGRSIIVATSDSTWSERFDAASGLRAVDPSMFERLRADADRLVLGTGSTS